MSDTLEAIEHHSPSLQTFDPENIPEDNLPTKDEIIGSINLSRRFFLLNTAQIIGIAVLGIQRFREFQAILEYKGKVELNIDKEVTFIPGGDSISAGVGSELLPIDPRKTKAQIYKEIVQLIASQTPFGWVMPLPHIINTRLDKKIATGTIIEGLVEGGMTTTTMLSRLHNQHIRDELRTYEQPILCIEEGPDDIFEALGILQNGEKKSSIQITKNMIQAGITFSNNLDKILATAMEANPNIQFVILSIPNFLEVPAFKERLRGHPKLTEFISMYIHIFNFIIKSNAYKYNAAYINITSQRIDPKEISPDKVHPRQALYDQIAALAIRSINILGRRLIW